MLGSAIILPAQQQMPDSINVMVFDDFYRLKYKKDVILNIELDDGKQVKDTLRDGTGKISRNDFTYGKKITWEAYKADEKDKYYKEKREQPYLDGLNEYSIKAGELLELERDANRLILPMFRKFKPPETSTATRRNDKSFGLANSITVLTRQQILSAGCTSIPEALRLIPGMIVREQVNGNFDVHIRGLDNVPPGGTFVLSTNTTTLVMIDGRPVYSYFSGGTFWETLPVGIDDIQQIDVIRGASAVMYGPNAAMGVINIVTRTDNRMLNQRTSVNDIYLTGNVSGGYSPGAASSFSNDTRIVPGGTLIGNLRGVKKIGLGKKDNKIFAGISASLQERRRHSDQYYNFGTADKNVGGGYVSFDSLVYRDGGVPPREDFPLPDLSLSSISGNAFFRYDYGLESQVRVSAGLEKSESQKIYSDDQMNPLLGYDSRTQYVDLFWNQVSPLSKEKEIYLIPNVQMSYLNGKQFIGGNVGYDFSNTDILSELMLEQYIENEDDHYYRLSIGYNYRNASYQTRPGRTTILSPDGEPVRARKILTNALVGRIEYQIDRLNLIGGLRGDFFNNPTEPYISTQGGLSFDIIDNENSRLLLRGMYGKAFRAPILTDLYFDQSYPPKGEGGGNSFFRQDVIGVDSLKLLRLRTIDLGIRWQYISTNNTTLFADIELFQVQGDNFTDAIIEENIRDGSQIVSPAFFRNIPLNVVQRGITFQVGGRFLRGKLSTNIYLTHQKTDLRDYSPYLNVQGNPGFDPGNITVRQLGNAPVAINPNTNTQHWKNTIDTTHFGTPDWFGGIDFTFKPSNTSSRKWLINGGCYLLGEQVFTHRNEIYYVNDDRAVAYIPAKVNFRFKVSRRFLLANDRNVECYFSGRSIGVSISENQSPFSSRELTEYAWGDEIRAGYLLGVRFEL